MKKFAFFLQNNLIGKMTAPIAQYALQTGHTVIDRSCTQDLDIMACDDDWWRYAAVIPYGSSELLRKFMKTPLSAHIVQDENGLSTKTWMQKFGNLALNHGGLVMPAKDVLAHLQSQGQAHVRPTSEHKALVATVFDADTWDEHSREARVREDLSVFVSKAKTIEREYRCWVIDGQVIEVSQYVVDQHLVIALVDDPAVIQAAQALANVYVPSHAVVMDMARTSEGFKFLEFNRFHCSGWYAARVDRVMDAYLTSLGKQLDMKPPAKDAGRHDCTNANDMGCSQ